jgi:hypothetical protein
MSKRNRLLRGNLVPYLNRLPPSRQSDPQSSTINAITGLEVYIRENRNDVVRRQAACNGQDSAMSKVNESSLTSSNIYTLTHADDELRQMWQRLGTTDKEEWEERAANERNFAIAVVSPGDSEEEVESANEPKSDVTESRGTTCDIANSPKDKRQLRREDDNLGNPECNEKHSDPALVYDSNVRRSKRPKKGKLCFEDDYQLDQEKPKAVHVPSVWAIPVSRAGGTILCDKNPKVEDMEVNPVEILSDAVKSSKRKRSEYPPKQIAQSSYWRLSTKQIAMCYYAATEHFDKVMYTVKARALFSRVIRWV